MANELPNKRKSAQNAKCIINAKVHRSRQEVNTKVERVVSQALHFGSHSSSRSTKATDLPLSLLLLIVAHNTPKRELSPARLTELTLAGQPDTSRSRHSRLNQVARAIPSADQVLCTHMLRTSHFSRYTSNPRVRARVICLSFK